MIVFSNQNLEFHLTRTDLFDQFGLSADETKLGVACVCEEVVELVEDRAELIRSE